MIQNSVEYYIIGKDNCPYCDKAKAMLDEEHIPYVYKNLSTLSEKNREVWVDFIKNQLAMTTVPVCLKVGGSTDLEEWLNE